MRTARRTWTPRRLPALAAVVAMIAGVVGAEEARAGLLGKHHDRGASQYPGNPPWFGPYDGPVPGWLPPGHGVAGPAFPIYHPWGRTPTGPAVPALWRYPMFHGYIPPAPHDDTLYQSGVFPWRRG